MTTGQVGQWVGISERSQAQRMAGSTYASAAFGLHGNVVPTIFSWFATLGWETINIILGTLGGSYWYSRGINWRAMTALVVGVVLGALFANTAQFQGFIAMDFLGGADLSPIVGFACGIGLYYVLATAQIHKALAVVKES